MLPPPFPLLSAAVFRVDSQELLPGAQSCSCFAGDFGEQSASEEVPVHFSSHSN